MSSSPTLLAGKKPTTARACSHFSAINRLQHARRIRIQRGGRLAHHRIVQDVRETCPRIPRH